MKGLNKKEIVAKSADIQLLELKLRKYLQEEEYEKAAVIKRWIDEINALKDDKLNNRD